MVPHYYDKSSSGKNKLELYQRVMQAKREVERQMAERQLRKANRNDNSNIQMIDLDAF